MKFRLLILAALSLVCPLVNGQDTLVYFDDLHFNSEFEKQALTKFIKQGDLNYLETFMAIDPSINSEKYTRAQLDYRTKFNSIYTDKVKSKKADKKLKIIYDEMHSAFLTQYKERSLQFNF